MRKKKRIIAIVICFIILAVTLTGCGSVKRSIKDMKSDFSNGLDRTMIVYTSDGHEIARYEGKIDIADEGDSKVKFDLNGRRYIYYNCFVEVIENEN